MIQLSAAAPKNWAESDFCIINMATEHVVDIDQPTEGAAVHSWTLELENVNAIFHFSIVDPVANTWTLRNTRTGFYLEVEDGKIDNNTNVVSRSRYGNADLKRHNQEWYIWLVEGAGAWPCVALQNVGSGTILNAINADKTQGGRIGTWQWDSAPTSVWKLLQQLDKKK